MKLLLRILDVLIPRFLDEDVVVELRDDGYHLLFPMSEVEPHEVFDGIVTMRTFNFFGIALFPKQIGEVRPFVQVASDDD